MFVFVCILYYFILQVCNILIMIHLNLKTLLEDSILLFVLLLSFVYFQFYK